MLLLLLVVANLFGVGMIVPQISRLRRTRIADGVSSLWVGVSLATNLGWLSYGIQGQLWGLLPVSLGALLVYAVVAVQLRSLLGSRVLLQIASSGAATSIMLVVALAVGGWPAVGLTLGLAYGPQFAPAVFGALRSGAAAGVSGVTWTMAAIEAIVWIVYGTAVGDQALIIGGIGGTLMSSVILARLSLTQARRRIVVRPSFA